MKHIQTFESFLAGNFSPLYEYSDKMISNRGIFEPGYIPYVWEESANWAFAKSLGLKDQQEIADSWNNQLDDPKSELRKAMKGLYEKGVADIERMLRNAGNDPQSIRDAIEQLGDRLAALKGVLSAAADAPIFLSLMKDGLEYAEKLEKDTPLEPVKIIIMPGTVIKSKGIKAKEYYEAGYVLCQYEVMVVMKDGRAMQGSGMYKSEDEAGIVSNSYRVNGNELAKQKIFLKRYEKAIDGSSPEVTTNSVLSTVSLQVSDTDDLKKADEIIKSKVVPALKKEFPEAEISF